MHRGELLLANSPDIADRIVRRVFGPLERAEAADLVITLRSLARWAVSQGTITVMLLCRMLIGR